MAKISSSMLSALLRQVAENAPLEQKKAEVQKYLLAPANREMLVKYMTKVKGWQKQVAAEICENENIVEKLYKNVVKAQIAELKAAPAAPRAKKPAKPAQKKVELTKEQIKKVKAYKGEMPAAFTGAGNAFVWKSIHKQLADGGKVSVGADWAKLIDTL